MEQMGCVQHMFETKLIKIADEEKILNFLHNLQDMCLFFFYYGKPASVYTSSDEACKKSVGYFKMHTDAYRSNAKDSLKVCHKVPEFHYLCGELQEFEDTVLKGVLSSPVIILCETDL